MTAAGTIAFPIFDSVVPTCLEGELFQKIAFLILSHAIDHSCNHSSPTGISRNSCPRVSMSSKPTPGGVPTPVISPRSLMYLATDRCKDELAGIKVFKSIMGPPCSHKKALASLGTKLILDPPTTWPLELMDCAELVAPRFPRSV